MSNNKIHITNKQMREWDSGVAHASTTISRHERRKRAALERQIRNNNQLLADMHARGPRNRAPMVNNRLWFNDFNSGIQNSSQVVSLIPVRANVNHNQIQPILRVNEVIIILQYIYYL